MPKIMVIVCDALIAHRAHLNKRNLDSLIRKNVPIIYISNAQIAITGALMGLGGA